MTLTGSFLATCLMRVSKCPPPPPEGQPLGISEGLQVTSSKLIAKTKGATDGLPHALTAISFVGITKLDFMCPHNLTQNIFHYTRLSYLNPVLLGLQTLSPDCFYTRQLVPRCTDVNTR